MKRVLLMLGLALAALTLSRCSEDSDTGVPEAGRGFELRAFDAAESSRVETDPNTYTVTWQGNETIGLYVTRPSDGALVRENVPMTNAPATLDRFRNDTMRLAAGSYNFYAYYPYSAYMKSDGSGYVTLSYQNVTVDAAAPTAHLSAQDFMYGRVESVTGLPTIPLAHAFSLMKVTVTNDYGSTLTPTSYSFVSTADKLGGQFNFDPVAQTLTRRTTTWGDEVAMGITAAPLANGASLNLFFMVNPVSFNGQSCTMRLETAENLTFTEDRPLTKNFMAGRVNTATFRPSAQNVVLPPPEATYALQTTDGAFADGGEYIVAMKSGTTDDWYFLQEGAAASNRSALNALAVSGTTITTDAVDYLWTAHASGAGFLLQNTSSGNYVFYNSGTGFATNNASGTVVVPTFIDTGHYRLQFGSTTGRFWSYYSTNFRAYAYPGSGASGFKNQHAAPATALQQGDGAWSIFRKQ